MDFFIDNSVINNMAIQLALILIIMLVAGVAIGVVLKIIKAPQWVFKPFITLAILVGMYFAFNIIT
ncbi:MULTISPECIES: hypothetical protein [Lysinibacillus]|uniref:hypothetical protein n=1 Tax=Lysinibacillus TaxID=400634 RepID=UPI00083CA049|nr:hypothetical protein [Lysinibacillus xylanilyticus]